ncbi:MAG: fibronectin type III domain-containing protein [Fibrobacteres bacterium]|nr:fibronectin type III domain-containing protein [Fibrobacterota bacterium]
MPKITIPTFSKPPNIHALCGWVASLIIGILPQPSDAAVTGRLVDASARPVSQAIVHIVGADMTDTTGADGRFSLPTLVSSSLPTAGPALSRLAARNGSISIDVASDGSDLSIELFHLSGQRIGQPIVQSLARGGYVFDLDAALPPSSSSGLVLARILLNGKSTSVMFFRSSATVAGARNPNTATTTSARGFATARLDSLDIVRKGYQALKAYVASYNESLGDLELSPKSFTISAAVLPTPGSGSVVLTPSQLTYTYGTQVTLNAIPAATYSFAGWTGDGASGTAPLALVVDTNKSVTANFSAVPPPGAPTGLTATTITTNSITLDWTDNSSNETKFRIDRSLDGLNWTVIDSVGASIHSYSNSGLLATTEYHFRVSAAGPTGASPYSNVLKVTTKSPQVGTIRIWNRTKYDMTSIKINGVEKLQTGYILPVGAMQDYQFSTPGNVSYSIMTGIGSNDFFSYVGTATSALGRIDTVSFLNPSLGELLSGLGPASRKWSGFYYDANLVSHPCSYTISKSGAFSLYDGTQLNTTGTATLVSWPDRANIVSFRLGTTETINMSFPFASFQQSNGPASWKVIEYTAQ